MKRLRYEPRSMRRLGALLGLAVGLALGGVMIASAAGGTNEPQEYVVVRHILYAGPNGELISEEAGSTTVSAQFVVNQHLWGANSLPVPVQYNADGAPGGLNVTSIITQAIGTWNGAGSGFSFAWSGSSSGDTGSCAPGNPQTDGTNTIRFVNLTGMTLGQTCTVSPLGQSTQIIEFDMELDSDGAWSSALPVPSDKYDLPTVILHELGHAAGLGDIFSSPESALMYWKLSAGQSKRALTQDDLDGILAAYPPGPTNTPTKTPIATLTNTPTSAPTGVPGSPTSFPIVTPTSVPTAQPTYKVLAPLLAKD